MSRTRTQNFAGPSGGKALHWFNNALLTNLTQSAWTPFSSSTCTDDVGYGVDHALSITHQKQNGVTPLTGITGGPVGHKYQYINWYPGFLTGVGSMSHNTLVTKPSNGALATTVRARSNPSKPYVSIPNFIYELKDLPSMYHDIMLLKLIASRALSKAHRSRLKMKGADRFAANSLLSIEMGWKPLIGDIRRLIDFQSRVDRKIDDLHRLFVTKEGLRRTVGFNPDANPPKGGKQRAALWSESVTTTTTPTIESNIGLLIQARLSKTTESSAWGSSRWASTALPSKSFSDKQLSNLARRLVLGLNVNPKAVWDAIPWTWLIGWFSNVDEYLTAYTNVIPCTCVSACVMQRTRTVTTWQRTDGWKPTFPGGEGSTTYETKSRSIDVGTLSASVPFISNRQISILGALAIQRKR